MCNKSTTKGPAVASIADRTGCQKLSRSSKVDDSFHLKGTRMQFLISDLWQPWPYLAPFSHNTSMTDRQTGRQTTTVQIAQPLLKYDQIKIAGRQESHNIITTLYIP